MKRSRQELSIDTIIHRVIFKSNQITLFYSTFIAKTGVSFYSSLLLKNYYFFKRKRGIKCQKLNKRPKNCVILEKSPLFKVMRLIVIHYLSRPPV